MTISETIVSRIAHRSVAHPPYLDGSTPWWSALPEDFATRTEHFALHPADVRPVRTTAGIDAVMRTGAALLLGSAAFPMGFRDAKIREILSDRAFYEDFADRADPTSFFVPPPTTLRAQSGPVRGPVLFTPRDGSVTDLTFLSPYRPRNPRQRPSYVSKMENRTAHARFWRHHGPPRPTIIAIHGFSADLYLVNEWFFSLPWLYRMGANVLLVTLPFHGSRQSRLSPFSGHGFFAGGIQRLHEALGQAVFDIRVFLNTLRDQGTPQIGVTGVSLGGYTTALLAGVEPSLAFAIPNVPVASFPDLVLEWQPLRSLVLRILRRHDLSLVELRKLLAPTCPLTYTPAIDRERLLVIGGVGDRLAPPKHSRVLWDHWGRCRIHWFPGSHLLHLDRGTYLHQVARFLRSIDFLDADHPGPG